MPTPLNLHVYCNDADDFTYIAHCTLALYALKTNEYVWQEMYFMEHQGRERWITAKGGRRGGEGEREDEHDKQDNPFVRVG
jgi:hypothetical protein